MTTVALPPICWVSSRPCLPSLSPDRARGRRGLCPGRRLQLSPQQLSLPQAPLPEAWLEACWHGCSTLAACKWIATPPTPVLTPSPAPQAPGTHPSLHSGSHCPCHMAPWHRLGGAGAGLGWGLCSGRRSSLSVSCLPIPDMRQDVQAIFHLTPHEKQCMMFSATLSKDIRPVCRKFMQDVSRMGCGQDLSASTCPPGPRS